MSKFKIFVFIADVNIINNTKKSCDGFIIDWENKGKDKRQKGYDTQINYQTVDDLKQIRALTDSYLICRIHRGNLKEVDLAISNGANEVLLPMVETVKEVEDTLKYIKKRCNLGILVETKNAVKIIKDLGVLPLSRIYVGLNDLSIEYKKSNIFELLKDGIIDHIRSFVKVPFGFGSLTLPGCGFPIPSHLLISETVRLKSSFAILRRSFFRDVKNNFPDEIKKIYNAIELSYQSSVEEIEYNRQKVNKIIGYH